MGSIDSSNNTPENILHQFEESLVKNIKALSEKKENLSKQDIKAFIRLYCKKNAATLGLSQEKALQTAQYFFKSIYDDPEAVNQMWELLHELSEHSTNPEAVNQIFPKLIETNKGGITPLWQLTSGIIEGSLSVEAVDIGNQNIYHLSTPKDSTERQKDENRQKISSSLKETIKDDIIQKPVPDIDATKMTQQDNDLFLKIPKFMQDDTDALINSGAWQPLMGDYFEGITKYLLSTINILSVEGTRSDARKKRYRNFIVRSLQVHLKSLIEYCKTTVGKPNESNPFVTDLLFEHYLLSNNFLIDGIKEPSSRIIEKKWSALFKKIQSYVEDNATIYGVHATEIGTGQMDVATGKTEIATLQEDFSESAKRTIIVGPPVSVSPQTGPQTGPQIKPVEKKHTTRQVYSSSMSASPYIGVVPGTAAEKGLIKLIRADIDVIFFDYAAEVQSKAYSKDFVEKLTEIAKTRISTHSLMTGFISRVIFLYNDLLNKSDTNEKNNVFDNISATFNAMGQGLSMPKAILKELDKPKSDDTSNIPLSSDLNQLKACIPSIDSEEFESLKEFLLRKKLYARFSEIENELKNKIIGLNIKRMGVFNELDTKLAIPALAKEEFIYYYKIKEAIINDAFREIDNLTGNWFTKHLKFGRSKHVKEEMQQYSNQLKYTLDKGWNQALKPTLEQYGKIIFGSDLYSQET